MPAPLRVSFAHRTNYCSCYRADDDRQRRVGRERAAAALLLRRARDAGRRAVIGFLADRCGKHRLFTIVALASLAPILVIAQLPRLPLAQAVAWWTLFFVLVTGRFGPAMAIVSSSAEPRLRGSFMSFNASVQMIGSALASLAAGLIISRAPDGTLLHFGAVGWLAAGCTLLCVLLARRIRVVPDASP